MATQSPDMPSRVAIVHYWLVGMRGGERVVEALCELFPDADVFTHVYVPEAISPIIRRHRVFTTYVARLPFASRFYQKYLSFMPRALEELDLNGYDLVISSESGPAKGVIVPTDALHLCYCHTPMRYAWDKYHEYLGTAGPITRFAMRRQLSRLRVWDVATADRVDHFIANSVNVRNRIRRHYRRDARVIYPPVDTGRFPLSMRNGDFYLFLGQLVGYKRGDIAVDAARVTGRKLVVIGDGHVPRSWRRAQNVRILGRQPDEVVADYVSNCRALLFPGEEDFGIVPVEAMASGKPVVAFAKGGALETVKDGLSGILFAEQTVQGMVAALRRFEIEEGNFNPMAISRWAEQFRKENFYSQMKGFIAESWSAFKAGGVPLPCQHVRSEV